MISIWIIPQKKAVTMIKSLDMGTEPLPIHQSDQYRQALSYALTVFALMAPTNSSTTSPKKHQSP
jgi:hypothetical protein